VPTYRWLSRQDEALCLCINQASRLHELRILFRAVSRLGDGIFWYALMVGLLVTQREAAAQPVLQMTLTGLACTLVYKWFKAKTTRARPYEGIHTIPLSADPLDPHSFPSGHTLHAVAFTLIALHHYPASHWPWFRSPSWWRCRASCSDCTILATSWRG
jgi:undecaprenyl-diphosphatase